MRSAGIAWPPRGKCLQQFSATRWTKADSKRTVEGSHRVSYSAFIRLRRRRSARSVSADRKRAETERDDFPKSFEMWWPGTELNRRRQPFQGCALPPELPGHFAARDFNCALVWDAPELRRNGCK